MTTATSDPIRKALSKAELHESVPAKKFTDLTEYLRLYPDVFEAEGKVRSLDGIQAGVRRSLSPQDEAEEALADHIAGAIYQLAKLQVFEDAVSEQRHCELLKAQKDQEHRLDSDFWMPAKGGEEVFFKLYGASTDPSIEHLAEQRSVKYRAQFIVRCSNILEHKGILRYVYRYFVAPDTPAESTPAEWEDQARAHTLSLTPEQVDEVRELVLDLAGKCADAIAYRMWKFTVMDAARRLSMVPGGALLRDIPTYSNHQHRTIKDSLATLGALRKAREEGGSMEPE